MRLFSNGMAPSSFILGVNKICTNTKCLLATTETDRAGRTITECPQCGNKTFYKGKKGQLANIIIKATRIKLNALARLSGIDYTGMLVDELKEPLINELNPENVSAYAELLGFKIYKQSKSIPKGLIFPVK